MKACFVKEVKRGLTKSLLVVDGMEWCNLQVRSGALFDCLEHDYNLVLMDDFSHLRCNPQGFASVVELPY